MRQPLTWSPMTLLKTAPSMAMWPRPYNTFDEDGDSLTVDFTPGTNDDGYYALVNGEVVLTPAGAELVNSGGTLPPVDLTVSDGSLTGQDS
ncbi:hypothetical protein CXF80_11470 [Shewanella sp. Actino-trap-3]|nr:hypothetical protein CXF80_11470 [Shewanella sp. Actino-trap-3]